MYLKFQLILWMLVVTCAQNITQHSNKVCYLLLHSRLYRESDSTHARYITSNSGDIIKALTIYNKNSSVPMVTVPGNNIDAMIGNLAGIDQEGVNMTYSPDYDYCAYLRIVKSANKLGINQEEKQILSDYDSLHRPSSDNVVKTRANSFGKRSRPCPENESCTKDTHCTKYGDLCDTCEVEVWSMTTGTCTSQEGGDESRGVTCAYCILYVLSSKRCKFFGPFIQCR